MEFRKEDVVCIVKKFKRKKKPVWYEVCGGAIKSIVTIGKHKLYYYYWFYQKESGYSWFKEEFIFNNLDNAFIYKKKKNDEVTLNEN